MLSVVPGLMIVHIRTKGVRMRTVYHKHLYLLPRSSVYISTLILTHKSFAWRRTVVRLQENDRSPPSGQLIVEGKGLNNTVLLLNSYSISS